jgi:hypothetical protein
VSQTIQGPDGNLYQFPEGTTKEAAVAYFKKKGIGRALAAVSSVRPDNAIDRLLPPGAAIGPERHRTGLGGLEDAISNLKMRFEMMGDRGFAQGATENLPLTSIPEGLLKILRGATKGAEGQPWQATKDIVGGGLKVGEIPFSFIAPESAAKKAAAMSSKSAAKMLTDAVNPAAEQLPRFEKAIGEHLDKIITFAASKGIKLDSLENLAEAMKEASTSIRSHYYDKLLGPFKDAPADLSAIKGYAGETSSPSTASLGQLDARLSQINAELSPKYGKASEIAARSAVKSSAELNAEASSIRKVLYGRLGELSGIGAEAVAKTRSAFGSLEKLAETTTESASTARVAANKAAREPMTLNPLSNTKQFVADKALAKLQGNPVAKAVRSAMSRAEVKPYALPEPNPAAMAAATRSAPIQGASRAIGTVGTPTAEEIAAQGQKLQNRVSQVLKSRGKIIRKPIWEMSEDELEQLRRGAGRPGTLSPLERMKVATDKVNSLKMQIARNPGDYNAVSQLRQAEDELGTLQKSAWPQGYQAPPKAGGGANYSAEDLAKLKKNAPKSWGLE